MRASSSSSMCRTRLSLIHTYAGTPNNIATSMGRPHVCMDVWKCVGTCLRKDLPSWCAGYRIPPYGNKQQTVHPLGSSHIASWICSIISMLPALRRCTVNLTHFLMMAAKAFHPARSFPKSADLVQWIPSAAISMHTWIFCTLSSVLFISKYIQVSTWPECLHTIVRYKIFDVVTWCHLENSNNFLSSKLHMNIQA